MAKALIIDLENQTWKLHEFGDLNHLVSLSSVLAASFAKLGIKKFLVFGRGELAGHEGIGLATATVTGVSPQSGGVVEAKVEGRLAKALLGLGVLAVAFKGKSLKLTGIKIKKNAEVDFMSAENFAGLDIWQTASQVREKFGEQLVVAAISKFGEAQKKAASIVIDEGFATSQGGLGGQAGSMNLKFVAFEEGIAKDNSVIKKLTDEYLSGLKNNPLTLSEYQDGFSLWIQPNLVGYQAGDNFSDQLPDSVAKFDAEQIRKLQVDFGDKACPGCAQSCLKSYSSDGHNPINGGRAHQLSIAAFVSQYADSDMKRAVQFNEECHRLGLEHLYACQLFIENKIDKNIEIRTALNLATEKELTDNSDLIKGMVIPPWDPRGSQGLGLAMALNPVGPRYDVIEHDIDFDPTWAWDRHTEFGYEFGVPEGGIKMGTLGPERIPSIKELWKLWSAIDSVGVCIYASPPTRELRLSGILEMVGSVLGREVSKGEFYEAGKLRLALQRIANFSLGLKDSGHDLPEKFFKVPIKAQVNSLAGVLINRDEWDKAKAEIFEEFSWSTDGGMVENSPLLASAKSLQAKVIAEIG